ncbi:MULTISPECIES: NAD(P)H-binding protein [unclassified Rhodococcus (in: high G+C Gram-positive bacteria)]|uniref:NAD(P)H-binding protein n=1 Tax=unclassified Rhodococcus (in: high G+C Gram-positive bacteria) TaxID=192944 RepID=UPI000BDBDC9A|nr:MULTISPECIES: NAD(P)H-binding protein [unclassified Rhodococcus (in: high G+C Gram-positive bacteria)]MBP1161145.1 uncharacterized protein YbjT (DUF2867 family) [Rhodococcus sp. PvR099]PTR39539.1 uncharacterized protein YbjT (DUF2867 family) [Rhodococcus sp. OK611]SNX92690.1 Uncharacterized conserved protein YbjT, contains NAD(P)-binding and DUF2867 domains [Rhodococcus sp. OK270]
MIVVTGATGNVGVPLVGALAAAGEQVTAVSRGSADAVPIGVRHRQADLTEPDSLGAAVEGAEALFLLVSGEVLAADVSPSRILDVARAGGVRRVVLLSSQVAGTRPDSPSHTGLRAFETAVKGSGMEWTVLRPAGFASNAFAWVETVRSHRRVAAPFGDVGLPDVDPADLAEAAAVVLREAGHAGRTYVLTGPAPVSPRQRSAAIGQALGEPVGFAAQSRDEARAQMLRFMPAPVVDGTLDVLGAPTPVEQQVSPDLEGILGRPPRTFAEWAARNVDAFR